MDPATLARPTRPWHTAHGLSLLRGPAPFEFLHFSRAADDQRRPLVNTGGDDVQDAPPAIRGEATGLFCDEGDRVGFVEQPQFAFRGGLRRWIEEHAPLQ